MKHVNIGRERMRGEVYGNMTVCEESGTQRV
jgi:hypothetical protein